MADVKWIKITTDIFDDEKILLIESMPDSDSILVIWLKLLCLAGKQNNGGVFTMNSRIAYTDEMLATIMRRPINTVRLAMSTFDKFGMVEIIDGIITIPNWEKHQNIEGMERIREQTRARVAKHRAKAKQLESGDAVTVTLRNATDKNREEEKREEKKDKGTRFSRPSLEEVSSYVSEKGYGVDPQRFIDFYESNGWKVGKNPMKDWRAAVRSWQSRDGGKAAKPDPNKGKQSRCPHCGHTAWRNTQSGTYFCDSCRATIQKGEVVWE